MKILVFGNSDSGGSVIEGTPWPLQLRDQASEALGGAVELGERGFWPGGKGAADFAEGMVRRETPDVVVLPLVTYAFALEFVSPRVHRLLGKRLGSWYRATERRFDRATRDGRLRPANVAARRLARRVIGVAPNVPMDEVAATYREVFRRLARVEAVQVVVLTYPRFGEAVERANPGLATRVAQFERERREAAAVHHFAWADGQAALDAAGVSEGAAAPDGFHLSIAAHAVYAALLAGLVLRLQNGDYVASR